MTKNEINVIKSALKKSLSKIVYIKAVSTIKFYVEHEGHIKRALRIMEKYETKT